MVETVLRLTAYGIQCVTVLGVHIQVVATIVIL